MASFTNCRVLFVPAEQQHFLHPHEGGQLQDHSPHLSYKDDILKLLPNKSCPNVNNLVTLCTLETFSSSEMSEMARPRTKFIMTNDIFTRKNRKKACTEKKGRFTVRSRVLRPVFLLAGLTTRAFCEKQKKRCSLFTTPLINSYSPQVISLYF
jgi:hypothetical protein